MGGTNNAVAGINLTNAELAQIYTTASGTVTIGDSRQTGNITFTTATPATTAGASTVVVQDPTGPGQIILDDGAGTGTGLDGNGGTVTLTPGTGGIEAVVAAAADTAGRTKGFTATGTSLTLDLNFAPTPGTQLTIIDNTAAAGTPISGTFANLPQGGTISASYGGDDLHLYRQLCRRRRQRPGADHSFPTARSDWDHSFAGTGDRRHDGDDHGHKPGGCHGGAFRQHRCDDYQRHGHPDHRHKSAGDRRGGCNVRPRGGTSATSSSDQFSYAPVVAGISPASGPTTGGTTVTITGAGFTGATAVDFGTVAASTFTVVSDSEITATSPAGTGTVDVTVLVLAAPRPRHRPINSATCRWWRGSVLHWGRLLAARK